MNGLFGSLAGKKTYISAALTIIGGLAGYLTGDVTPAQLFQLVSTAIMAASIRHGVANS